MATIKINNLNPAGSDFFADHETFLTDLHLDDLVMIQGGLSPLIITTVAVNSWWFVGGAVLGGAGAIGWSIYRR